MALEAAQQVIQVVQDEKLLLELDVLVADARTEAQKDYHGTDG